MLNSQVKARLNLHGIVSVESATQMVEETYEEPVKVAKGETANVQAADAVPAAPADAPMQVQRGRTRDWSCAFKALCRAPVGGA